MGDIERNETTESRYDRYRDLLETWAEWWNGPGRHGYRDPVIPPLTATGEALMCTICAGESGQPGDRCQVCGRRMWRWTTPVSPPAGGGKP